MVTRRLRTVAPLGAVNIHPSLLPRLRGPDPLFWTLREGSGVAGVTVHRLTGRFDAGPIYAQEGVEYAPGTTESELEALLAETGANLAVGVIDELVRGTAEPRPQDDSLATYAGWPDADDYVIDLRRPARAAYTFARGIQERGVPVVVDTGKTRLRIDEAIAWLPEAPASSDAFPPDAAILTFADGVLVARVTPFGETRTLLP